MYFLCSLLTYSSHKHVSYCCKVYSTNEYTDAPLRCIELTGMELDPIQHKWDIQCTNRKPHGTIAQSMVLRTRLVSTPLQDVIPYTRISLSLCLNIIYRDLLKFLIVTITIFSIKLLETNYNFCLGKGTKYWQSWKSYMNLEPSCTRDNIWNTPPHLVFRNLIWTPLQIN